VHVDLAALDEDLSGADDEKPGHGTVEKRQMSVRRACRSAP
jgi:hypothetical protein